ncbi:MAG TPA: hypothetical protein VEX38_01670 [Fimbriimonadaceae bacterium]|nr:hypothetical protein [Fimbriimonadaceae bacterium]
MWTQGLVSFAVWIAYGVVQWRRSSKIYTRVSSIDRQKRITGGAVLMLLGALVLLGGLYSVELLGGFTRTGMTPLGWLLVTLVGLAFIHSQTVAAAMLVSLVGPTVTEASSAASSNRDTENQP